MPTMLVQQYIGSVGGRKYAGAAYIKVSGGTPGNTLNIMRVSQNGPETRLRYLSTTPFRFNAQGVFEYVDAESGFGEVEYFLDGDPAVRDTAFVYAPRLDENWREMKGYEAGIIRQITHPQDKWVEAVVQDEQNITYPNRSGVFRVIGRADPVVVNDRRSMPQSDLTFLVPSIVHADNLLKVLDATLPLMLVTPCYHLVRNRVFLPLDVTEGRWNKKGWRLITVNTQTVPLPQGDLYVPNAAAQQWNYGNLAANVTLPSYGQIAPSTVDPNDYVEVRTEVIP